MGKPSFLEKCVSVSTALWMVASHELNPENNRIVPNLVFPASNVVEVVPGAGPQLWDETDVPHTRTVSRRR